MTKAKKQPPAPKRPGLFDDISLPDIHSIENYVIKTIDDTDNGAIRVIHGLIEIASYETLHLSLPNPTRDTGSISLTIQCYAGRRHTLAGVFGRFFDRNNPEPYVQRIVFNHPDSRVILTNGCDRWIVTGHHNMSIAEETDTGTIGKG